MSSAFRPDPYRSASRAILIGLVINAGLGAVKLVGGLIGNSFALIADAVKEKTGAGTVDLGNRRQDFVLQWAGTREELEQRLKQSGWQSPPPSNRGLPSII